MRCCTAANERHVAASKVQQLRPSDAQRAITRQHAVRKQRGASERKHRDQAMKKHQQTAQFCAYMSRITVGKAFKYMMCIEWMSNDRATPAEVLPNKQSDLGGSKLFKGLACVREAYKLIHVTCGSWLNATKASLQVLPLPLCMRWHAEHAAQPWRSGAS